MERKDPEIKGFLIKKKRILWAITRQETFIIHSNSKSMEVPPIAALERN